MKTNKSWSVQLLTLSLIHLTGLIALTSWNLLRFERLLFPLAALLHTLEWRAQSPKAQRLTRQILLFFQILTLYTIAFHSRAGWVHLGLGLEFLIITFFLYQNHQPTQEGANLIRILLNSLKLSLSAAILLALIIEFFPRLGSTLFDSLGFNFDRMASLGVGDEDHLNTGQWSQLRNSNDIVFHAQIQNKLPPPSGFYWRVRTLDHPKSSMEWQKSLTDLTPTQPKSQPKREKEETSPQLVILRKDPLYPKEVTLHTSTPQRLSLNMREVYTRLPMKDRNWIRQFAMTLKQTPKTTFRLSQQGIAQEKPLELIEAERVLSYFSNHLRYTMDLGQQPIDSIQQLILDRKQGACEHFASAFALLMRAQGVPSRVVIGFQGGRPSLLSSWWTIRQRDAHAWVELWIKSSQTWIPIDPTAFIPSQSTESVWRPWEEVSNLWDRLEIQLPQALIIKQLILTLFVLILLGTIWLAPRLRKQIALSKTPQYQLIQLSKEFYHFCEIQGWKKEVHEGITTFEKRLQKEWIGIPPQISQFLTLYQRAYFANQEPSTAELHGLRSILNQIKS